VNNILILSPYPENLIEVIKSYGDKVFVHNESINVDFLKKLEIDYIVCFGYKYIICKDVINYLPNRIFNLHISYLPFNKGYYPNLWSHIDKTPSGVSIHQIDEGIDTGKIHFRKKIEIDIRTNTLETSYLTLINEIQKLFFEKWEFIRTGESKGFVPKEIGTFHLKKEGDLVLKKLDSGWNTKLYDLVKIKKEKI
tara:strand:+ start:771 stop:1355 length:585 start_codon:yes stop_codon:yes gene_type:complete